MRNSFSFEANDYDAVINRLIRNYQQMLVELDQPLAAIEASHSGDPDPDGGMDHLN